MAEEATVAGGPDLREDAGSRPGTALSALSRPGSSLSRPGSVSGFVRPATSGSRCSPTNSLALAAAAAAEEKERSRARGKKPRRPLIPEKTTVGGDLTATEARLYDMLMSKSLDGGDSLPVLNSVVSRISGSSLVAEGEDALSDNSVATAAAGAAGATTMATAADLEEEREAFLAGICVSTTRRDVRDCLSRIFHFAKTAEAMNLDVSGGGDAPTRRRRAISTSASSDSGSAGASTFATFAHAGSIAATSRASRKQQNSALSLVVHQEKYGQLLSPEERLRAYLSNAIPELTEHVHAHIRDCAKSAIKKLDEDDAPLYLHRTRRRGVYSDRENEVRWSNTRHKSMQRHIHEKMPRWILEAIDTWDQQKALQAREVPVSEPDLVYEYLTKRAARISSDKLPSEIPMFDTMHASYMLPRMWRDRAA